MPPGAKCRCSIAAQAFEIQGLRDNVAFTCAARIIHDSVDNVGMSVSCLIGDDPPMIQTPSQMQTQE